MVVVPYSNHGCLVSYTRAICVSFTPGSTVDMQSNLSGQMCLHSEHDWLDIKTVGCLLTCSDTDLKRYIENAVEVDPERPVLVDKYMDRADELDVDALADKDGNVTICGIMQHIEQAGVHSGMLVSHCDTLKTDTDGNVTSCGIMQHCEQAGAHSGMLRHTATVSMPWLLAVGV